jgi:3-oxoadipate enol-lactonase
VAARRIDVGGHALGVDSQGIGPPHLVCLHGLGDTRAIWSRVASALAERGQVVLGHSLGGIVAMTTALAHPERVAGLVLLGTASQCSARVASWYETLARAAETDGLAGLGRAIFGPGSARTGGDPQGLAHVTRCLASLADDPLTPELAALACPVLLVVGENDPMGVGASVIIQRQVRHAVLEVLPGRGHWLHVEAPDLLVRAIDRMLPDCG